MLVEPLCSDGVTKPLHEPLVEPEVVLGHQHRAEDLTGPDEMVDLSALERRAGRTRASRLQRLPVLAESSVADVQGTVSGEGLAGST